MKVKICCFSVFKAITFPVAVKEEVWPLCEIPVAPDENGCPVSGACFIMNSTDPLIGCEWNSANFSCSLPWCIILL